MPLKRAGKVQDRNRYGREGPCAGSVATDAHAACSPDVVYGK